MAILSKARSIPNGFDFVTAKYAEIPYYIKTKAMFEVLAKYIEGNNLNRIVVVEAIKSLRDSKPSLEVCWAFRSQSG